MPVLLLAASRRARPEKTFPPLALGSAEYGQAGPATQQGGRRAQRRAPRGGGAAHL